MNMNLERAAYKGRLSELKLEKMRIESRISADVKAAKSLLAMFAITPIMDVDIEAAAINLSQAAAGKQALRKITADIAVIEKELA